MRAAGGTISASGMTMVVAQFAAAGSARAAEWPTISWDPFAAAVLSVAVAVIAWAYFVLRRLIKSERSAMERAAALEERLNEAEAALAAESHILIVWRGRDTEPERISGSMHGLASVPEEQATLLDFPRWLEGDSAAGLAENLSVLRKSGTNFNIGVKTLRGELLEADGSAAGSFATLRFRPTAGERRQFTETAFDVSKLGKQVERLSAVLDAAPLPVWLRGPDGKLAWVNQAYAKAVEVADSSAAISAAIEIASPQRLDTHEADPKTGLAGRAHTVVGGAMRALNIYEVGLQTGSAGFAVDVTELEEAEKELDRHIKAHASTLNKLDTAIAIFGPDQRLRFHNAAYAQFWPLDPQWLEQRPSDGEILDRLRSQRCIPEQANYREWRARQLLAYTTLEARENWWYLPDGRSLHVVCEQHPFGGVTYLYEDVTREIQLESLYNELIGVQRETLDNLEEGVALIASNGRLKLFNPAFATFWGFETAMLDKEPHIDELTEFGRKAAAGGSTWDEIKFVATGIDSERKALRGNVSASGRILQYATVPLADGNTLLTFADVSASAKMERALRDRTDALEAADKLKNAFLTNVSYEVRTPLTSILGFAETLDLGLVGALNAKQREYVVNIRRSSEDLKRIIDSIIDLSAIDAGALELKLSPIDVAEVMQAAAEKLAQAIERRNLTLNIEVASDSGSFTGDPQRVLQVLQNLLSNAIGFSSDGATIRMGARASGSEVQLWVADSGRGIDPDFQKRAFERFQSRSLPGGHRGPGLGLAIVKSFVELHDGKVALLSKPGQGTTVICSFPRSGPREKQSGPRLVA
jgi:signal transduction histidine kinase